MNGINKRLKKKNMKHERWAELFSGVVSTVGAVVLTYPLTNIRIRLVSQLLLPEQSRPYTGPLDAASKIYLNGGWKGNYFFFPFFVTPFFFLSFFFST